MQIIFRMPKKMETFIFYVHACSKKDYIAMPNQAF